MTTEQHRIRWYALEAGEMVARKGYMTPGNGWTGFDATCSCGWRSATGGAIQARVAELAQRHLDDAIAGRAEARHARRRAARAARIEADRQRWVEYHARLRGPARPIGDYHPPRP